jgi:hypothetical protein
MVLPDIVHYLIVRPDVLDLSYSARHLFNPVRTLANWRIVEGNAWVWMPFAIGLTGLLAYGALIHRGRRTAEQPAPIDPQRRAAATGELGRADVID